MKKTLKQQAADRSLIVAYEAAKALRDNLYGDRAGCVAVAETGDKNAHLILTLCSKLFVTKLDLGIEDERPTAIERKLYLD